ncbi:MAG: hypothetical protein V3R47_01465, partial [candidate division NC10 bacterium]
MVSDALTIQAAAPGDSPGAVSAAPAAVAAAAPEAAPARDFVRSLLARYSTAALRRKSVVPFLFPTTI